MPVRITAKKDGFRRCGVAHPAQSTEYPDDQFSKKQLAALQAEPMLVVEITVGKPTADKPPKAEELIKLIKAAETVEMVDEILGNDERATVIAAAAARKEELASAE
jgi:hypothetical protein